MKVKHEDFIKAGFTRVTKPSYKKKIYGCLHMLVSFLRNKSITIRVWDNCVEENVEYKRNCSKNDINTIHQRYTGEKLFK